MEQAREYCSDTMSGKAIFASLLKNKTCELAIGIIGFGLSLNFLLIPTVKVKWEMLSSSGHQDLLAVAIFMMVYSILSLLLSIFLIYGAKSKNTR